MIIHGHMPLHATKKSGISYLSKLTLSIVSYYNLNIVMKKLSTLLSYIQK